MSLRHPVLRIASNTYIFVFRNMSHLCSYMFPWSDIVLSRSPYLYAVSYVLYYVQWIHVLYIFQCFVSYTLYYIRKLYLRMASWHRTHYICFWEHISFMFPWSDVVLGGHHIHAWYHIHCTLSKGYMYIIFQYFVLCILYYIRRLYLQCGENP